MNIDFRPLGYVIFLGGFIIGAFIASLITMDVTTNFYKNQAIERGYALHCPTNGKFAWKGEC